MPSRITTKPMPPASTTPAFFSTGLRFTVSSSASSPALIAHSSALSRLAPAFAASTAAAAARRETVSMVPSAGFITALYAASTPSDSAPANSAAPAVSMPLRRRDMPRNSSDRITPELPRAPRSSADATQEAAASIASKLFFLSSAAALFMVRLMLVPVSPSGTGKTLRSLII